jgi:hypothetical protein
MVTKSINNIREGNWAGLATDLASVAVSFIPGVGTAAAMALQAGVQAGGAALQGGSAGDIAKAGAMGAAGAGAGAAIGKFGGSLLSKASTGLKNTVSKVKMSNTGQMTGAAADITTTQVTDTAVEQTLAQKIGAAKQPVPGQVQAPGVEQTLAQKIGAKAPGPVKFGIPKQGAETAANTAVKQSGIKAFGAKVANSKVGKAVGQHGIQEVLAAGSMVAGAKQASAANKVSQQSLLFQKQTYAEQTAKEEKSKAQLKEDAWTSYTSSQLFGESLYADSPSSTNLLTSYTSNGTGNAGNYSLLSTSIKVSKSTDIT